MIIALIVLILLSASFSGAETALFSLSHFKLFSYASSPDPRQRLIAHLMEKPRDVLVTILILNTLANLLVQNTMSGIFDEFSSWWLKVGFPLAITLIFAEVLPKSISLPRNTKVAALTAPWIDRFARWLKPIRIPLTKITSFISRFVFLFMKKEEEISPDELRHVLKTSEESGILLPEESELINGVLDLKHSLVKEHMRPRDEVVFYAIHHPLDELLNLFVDQEVTRIPVCDGKLENLLGIISARGYFFHRDQIQKPEDLVPFLKKPTFVPEAIKAWALLGTLRERHESLAIVVDEYGSITGLITQEDLIEAVVGEISDRRDVKRLYTRTGNEVIASGKLELSEFEEIFGIPLKSEGNIVTLGGWLIEQLGDIPTAGTKFATDQFLFYVLAADPNRIRRIYVRKLPK